jgi:hypothetical protein
MKSRLAARLLALTLLCGVALVASAGVRAEDEPKPDFGMAGKRTVTPDVAGYAKQHGPFSQFECFAASGGANTRLDCDDPFPNNEPDIEVDPAAAGHMIASSNDYGSCCDEIYTTFNAGATWANINISRENPAVIGSDPVTVFDSRHGTAIHSSLNFNFSLGRGETCRGDVVVSVSTDGGIRWLRPVIVDTGIGCDTFRTQLFNDKEWIVTDNNPSSPFYGRTYLTWTKFIAASGDYLASPIFESHSDDGGFTWSTPQAISGSNPVLCTFQESGATGVCDENQFSVPTVAPDGTVYVAFENEQNQALWEAGEQFDDQYLLVKSTNGGVTWSSPTFVVGLEDGSRDYPLNVDGRQTLTGYQVRVNSAGNIDASPRASENGKLYLVFSDNRNGTHDVDSPVTNVDVFLMTSTNGGATWSGPTQVDASPTDQWFPWVDVNPTNGTAGILYNDREVADRSLYDAALMELRGSKTIVSTAPSHPTRSAFFQAEVPGCETCATFHGDYINIDYGPDGHANMVWTDMRDPSDEPGLFSQFIYFARR